MSDMSPDSEGGLSVLPWPLPAHMLGAASDPSRHALLLDRCFDGPGTRWSDALIARTRRHIGGCTMAVETALRLELERIAADHAELIEAVPDALGWAAIQRRPSVLDADLVRHFRDRAAISLMLQDDQTGGLPQADEEMERLFPAAAVHSLSLLMLAQADWHDSNPDAAPMRADLPAEAMERLVWMLAALIADSLGRTGLLPVPEILSLIDRTGRAALARHDEQTGPLGLAMLLVHQTRDRAMGEGQLLWLARNRQMLALIAVMADRIGVEAGPLVSMVVEAPEHWLFRLCRSADFPREVAVRLVLGRRSISRGVEDSVLVQYADEYEGMTRAEAAQALAPLGVNTCFRSMLAALRDRGGGDEG